MTTQTPSTHLDVLVTPPNQTISSADVAPVDPTEVAQVHAALSHPYFSNHPTQTAASGVGDIIIGSPASAKRRSLPRPVLFGLIGFVAVLAISGVVLAISSALGGGSPTGLKSYRDEIAEAEKDFYRFSNLILYGDDNENTPIAGAYSRWDAYELTAQFYKEPHEVEFWEKAEKYLTQSVNTFVEATNKYDTTKTDVNSLSNNLQQFLLNFQFLSDFHDIAPIDELTIYSVYYEQGEMTARDYVENYYDNYNNSSTAGSEFISQKVAHYNALIDYIKLFADIGCLSQDGISGYCPNINIGGEELLAASGTINGYEFLAEETIQALVHNTESNCWAISQQLANLLEELSHEEN